MTAPMLQYNPGGNEPGNGPLRTNGGAGSLSMTKPNLPSTKSGAVEKQEAAMWLARDCFEGQFALHDKTTQYLPKAPGEDPINYNARLKRSVFFNMFRTAIEGLVGFIMRKDPVLGEDVPGVIATDWENIDLAGTHGDVFLRDLLQDAMIDGHALILVDYADTGGLVPTRGEEQAYGMRPYWVPIRKGQIVSFRESNENGQTILTQLVIRETTMVPEGVYGEKEQTVYRVLANEGGVVTWRVEMITKENTVQIMSNGVFRNQVEIPVAEVVTSGRVGRLVSRPTLEDVAYLNIAHYQQYSDYANSMHKTCVPIFTVSGGGESEGPLVLGPDTSFQFTSPDAKAAYVSHDGASLGACKLALDDLKSDIGTASLAMLAPQKRAAETAKGKEIDKGASDSKLSVTARGLQDGAERALGFHARFRGIKTGGGSLTINREYTDMSMAPEMLTALSGAVRDMKLPVRLALVPMQKGGIIDESEDLTGIEREMEASMIAEEEKAAAQLEAQFEMAASAKQPQQKVAA